MIWRASRTTPSDCAPTWKGSSGRLALQAQMARGPGTVVHAWDSVTEPRQHSCCSAGDPPGEQVLAPATAAQVHTALQSTGGAPAATIVLPQAGTPGLRLLRRVGVVDPTSLDAYRAHGGYAALRRALELGPEEVIREVNDAKLLGRGGAAFPTGRKWEAVARAAVHPHYLICNADESEPGTFKDRILMEEDPFAVIEAMTIAGFATGCQQGYLYIRGEYPGARYRLAGAIAQARARGLLGDKVMGHGMAF